MDWYKIIVGEILSHLKSIAKLLWKDLLFTTCMTFDTFYASKMLKVNLDVFVFGSYDSFISQNDV